MFYRTKGQERSAQRRIADPKHIDVDGRRCVGVSPLQSLNSRRG